MANYYQLPLRTDWLMNKKRLPVCSLKHSIAQHLHLILSTYHGETAFAESYGCSLWNEEFNIQLNLRWKESCCESLKYAIERFEKRFQLKDIRVTMEERTENVENGLIRARKCLHIDINGVIIKTNEQFHFNSTLFISPLAQR